MAKAPPLARSNSEMLRRRLAYDPETGIVIWRDGKNAGLEAGTLGRKYRQITIDGVTYFSHIVAWLLMTGEFPPTDKHVDHRNRDKHNNRWKNLRLCTPAENKMNEIERTIRASPVRGATWDKGRQRWRLRMIVRGKFIYLGQYLSIDEVRRVRIAAERKYCGEFAPARSLYSGL